MVEYLRVILMKNKEESIDVCVSYPRHKAVGYENDIPLHYIIYCPKCGSDKLIKSGKTKEMHQRMQCKLCNHRFIFSTHWSESAKILQVMLLFYKNSSLTYIAKEVGLHPRTVSDIIDKYLL